MPIISNVLDARIEEVLSKNVPNLKSKESGNSAINVLESRGAGLEDAAQTVADILQSAGDDSLRLRAAEMIFRANKVFETERREADTSIVFNFADATIQVNNILRPTRIENVNSE